MLSVGLGNQKGAETTHIYALKRGYEAVITEIAGFLINKLPVLFAIGITENWKGQVQGIHGILPNDILTEEANILQNVKTSTIKLPFRKFDVLLVKEIGKNISGTGMDTKIIGRIKVVGQKEPQYPRIGNIVVFGITPESHGNATGIGLADFTTRRVLDSIDFYSTSINCISSMAPAQGRLPCVLQNDYEAIKAAIITQGIFAPVNAKLVYIKNTATIDCFAVSESMSKMLRKYPEITILRGPEEMSFDFNGKLLNFEKEFSSIS